MTVNILSEAKGKEIILADGKIYTLSPLNLNSLANLEEAFESSLDKLMDKFGERQASTFRLLLFVLLKENHPDLTLQDAGKLVPMDRLVELSNVLGEILAVTEKTAETVKA